MGYVVRPIGFVENDIKKRGRFVDADGVSRIVLQPEYGQGLEGIERFSHVMVVFWLHKITGAERAILKVHPRKDPAIPLTGVFSTRSPARPNPLGITSVQLLKHDGNILVVKGLDAIDGTPVVDIKPFLPEPFADASVRTAQWYKGARAGRRKTDPERLDTE